jgi:hypothetical protein
MGPVAGSLNDLAVQEEEHAALEKDLERQLVKNNSIEIFKILD